MLDIKIQSLNKDDFEAFRNTPIKTPSGKIVRLYEICEFTVKKSFEQLTKDGGVKNFYVYANVDTKIITAGEVLEKIDPLLNEYFRKKDINQIKKIVGSK